MIHLNCFYNYEQINKMVKELQVSFPKLVRVRQAGVSEDKRIVEEIIVGHGNAALICTAGVHGRESVNPVVLLKMIETYCMAYQNKECLQGISPAFLLENYKIVFVPLANPDGYEIATGGFDTIRNSELRRNAKSRNIAWEKWKYNARGIDINRNFPSVFYRTDVNSGQPGSEAETKILMDLFARYHTIGFLDFHSRGNLIYYFRNALTFEYNRKQKKYAEVLSQACGYELADAGDEMETENSGGNSVQYYAEQFEKAAITVETLRDNVSFPLNFCLQKNTYREIVMLPLLMIEHYHITM